MNEPEIGSSPPLPLAGNRIFRPRGLLNQEQIWCSRPARKLSSSKWQNEKLQYPRALQLLFYCPEKIMAFGRTTYNCTVPKIIWISASRRERMRQNQTCKLYIVLILYCCIRSIRAKLSFVCKGLDYFWDSVGSGLSRIYRLLNK